MLQALCLSEQTLDNAYGTWQNEFAPREDSDQPGFPLSLIRVFAVRSAGICY